jgi:cation transport protein ChaC
VRARSGDRSIVALAFAVRRDHPQYAALSLDEQADTIASACGAFGSSCEYLMKTRDALAAHGVSDRYLDTLADAVTERQRAAPPG